MGMGVGPGGYGCRAWVGMGVGPGGYGWVWV